MLTPRRIGRILGFASVGIIGLLILLSSFGPDSRQPTEVGTRIAINVPPGPDGQCTEPSDVLRVLPGALSFNGKTMSTRELELFLPSALANRANRVVFVDGTKTASFGEVARALSLLRDLQIEAAVLTPGLDPAQCLGLRRSGNADKSSVQTLPWWRFW